MTSSFHGESGRAEGENEKEKSWDTAVCVGVRGRNVNEHDTGCDVSHNDYKCAHSLLFNFFHFLSEGCLCVDLLSCLMPSHPSHLWTTQHRCVCSVINELFSQYNKICRTWWHKHSMSACLSRLTECNGLHILSVQGGFWLALELHLTFKHKHLRAADLTHCLPLSHVIIFL